MLGNIHEWEKGVDPSPKLNRTGLTFGHIKWKGRNGDGEQRSLNIASAGKLFPGELVTCFGL